MMALLCSTVTTRLPSAEGSRKRSNLPYSAWARAFTSSRARRFRKLTSRCIGALHRRLPDRVIWRRVLGLEGSTTPFQTISQEDSRVRHPSLEHLLSLARREDTHPFAILCHSSAGDRNPIPLQGVCDLLIRERI